MSFPGHKTILIVDNDRAEADALAQFIGNQGHRVLIAHDTEAGLDLSRKASLDIILHDLDLPSIDGYMAARLLRSDVASYSASAASKSGSALVPARSAPSWSPVCA